MKLKDFLENPVGRGDSSLNRAALRSMLDSKYDALVKNKDKQFTVKIYHKLNSDEYFIHLVIPTETARDNSYDVVLYFYPESNEQSMSLLNTHNVLFFCNAPSFAYTFAKVYDTENLLIPELKNKFPDEIFGSNPEVRNRYGIVNYDKYLYFGCKYVYESRLLNRAALPLKSITYNSAIFQSKVRTLDKIMVEYKKAQDKLKKKDRDKLKEAIDIATKGKVRTKVINPTINEVKKITGSKNTVKKISKKSKKSKI